MNGINEMHNLISDVNVNEIADQLDNGTLVDWCAVWREKAREALVEIKAHSINEIAKDIHINAREHGWWEDERELPEIIALCHSELSEALEAYRNNEPMCWRNGEKPDGIAVEMGDCVIRIFDYLAYMGIDIEYILLTKHAYNKLRPYKHGNKKI